MDKFEIRNFLNKSYKTIGNKFLIEYADEDRITIVDIAGFHVPYRYIAKKLINKFNTEMVIIKVGSINGNGWLFTKSSLNIK